MAKIKLIETTIDQLIPDDKNFNLGNEFGEHLIEKSFTQFGAGRGILVDQNNRIIAGNKSVQKFVETGGAKVVIVETTGDTIVVNKRIDIDLDSAQGRGMALADNATAKANITFDEVVIDEICGDLDIDVKEWGISFDYEPQQDETSYSDKNKEIDTNDFSDKMELKFEVTSEEYQFIQSELSKINASKEIALLKLLKYEV